MKLFMASIPIIKEAMHIGKLIQIPTLDFLIFRFLSNAVILIVFSFWLVIMYLICVFKFAFTIILSLQKQYYNGKMRK